jgi:hypothetical protein
MRIIAALGTVVVAAGWMFAQGGTGAYPKMAPVEQYMMERGAEAAMARTGAPESISHDSEVLVMGRRGYETVAKGTNGWACLVLRGWTAGVDDPVFWNPKIRGPVCLNPAATRTYLPIVKKRTELALAGRSKEEIAGEIKKAFDRKELPVLEAGAMSYMMSKEGYLSDDGGHWHPHVMLFVPLMEEKTWGAGLAGVPLFGGKNVEDRMTLIFIVVAKWSDGTMDAH